jgi:hypothetical protein
MSDQFTPYNYPIILDRVITYTYNHKMSTNGELNRLTSVPFELLRSNGHKIGAEIALQQAEDPRFKNTGNCPSCPADCGKSELISGTQLYHCQKQAGTICGQQ